MVECSFSVTPLHCKAGGSLRPRTRTEIGRARVTYLRGECSHRRAEEEKKEEEEEMIQRRSIAGSQF